MVSSKTRRSSSNTPNPSAPINVKSIRKSIPPSCTQSKAYECPKPGCTWTFPDLWKLQRHLRSHEKSMGKNPIKSASASPRSNASSDLLVAKENPKFIEAGPQLFACSECDYDTTVRSCMESHVLIIH